MEISLFQLLPDNTAVQEGQPLPEDTATDPLQHLISSVTFMVLMSISSLVIIALLVLSIVFRNHQPLKSRSPLVHYLLLVVLFYMQWEHLWGALAPRVVTCYVTLGLTNLMVVLMAALFILRTARVVFFMNMNKYRSVLFDESVRLHQLREKTRQERLDRVKKKKIQAQQQQRGSQWRKSQKFSSFNEAVKVEDFEFEQSPIEREHSITNSHSETVSNASGDELESGVTDSESVSLSPKERRAIVVIKILRFLASEWFTAIFIVVLVLIFYSVVGAFVAVTAGHCINPGSSDAFVIWSTFAYLYIVGMIIALLVLYDIIVNIKQIVRCQIRRLLFREDRFLFRIEFIATVLMMIFLFGSDFPLQFIPGVSHFVRVQYPVIGVTNLWIAIIATIFSLNGFVVIATVWRWFSMKVLWKSKMTRRLEPLKNLDCKENLVEYLMQHDMLLTHFKEFAKSEWSLENVLLYETIMQWTRVSGRRDRILFARRMVDTYIKPGSISEVNLPGLMVKQIMDQVQNASADDPLPKDLFHSLLFEVKTNLSDTAARFLLTTAFTRAMERMAFQEELLRDV